MDTDGHGSEGGFLTGVVRPVRGAAISIFAKVRAVWTVRVGSLPGNAVANRVRRSRRLFHRLLASPGRTPAGFTVNSRGWSEARATPPDSRRSGPEPRRGSPDTTLSNRSGNGTTPPGWQALRAPGPGVRSCLAHPRLFTDNPSGVGLANPGSGIRNDCRSVFIRVYRCLPVVSRFGCWLRVAARWPIPLSR